MKSLIEPSHEHISRQSNFERWSSWPKCPGWEMSTSQGTELTPLSKSSLLLSQIINNPSKRNFIKKSYYSKHRISPSSSIRSSLGNPNYWVRLACQSLANLLWEKLLRQFKIDTRKNLPNGVNPTINFSKDQRLSSIRSQTRLKAHLDQFNPLRVSHHVLLFRH
jgi:hypothetical protein